MNHKSLLRYELRFYKSSFYFLVNLWLSTTDHTFREKRRLKREKLKRYYTISRKHHLFIYISKKKFVDSDTSVLAILFLILLTII